MYTADEEVYNVQTTTIVTLHLMIAMLCAAVSIGLLYLIMHFASNKHLYALCQYQTLTCTLPVTDAYMHFASNRHLHALCQ